MFRVFSFFFRIGLMLEIFFRLFLVFGVVNSGVVLLVVVFVVGVFFLMFLVFGVVFFGVVFLVGFVLLVRMLVIFMVVNVW